MFLYYLLNLTKNQTEDYPLLPSLNLRMKSDLGQLSWLELSKDVERFLNLTLSLINPDLYRSGLEMLRKLRKLESTKGVALKWQSVHSGVAIVSNRLTPSHRDNKGRPEWYDTLFSYSDSYASPRLLIEDIGLNLEYSSGAVVSLCGSVLTHEVGDWGGGDRVCYAHFMRESVRKRLKVPPAGWVHRKIYNTI